MAIRNWWKRKCPQCGGLLDNKTGELACPLCSAQFESNTVVHAIVMVGVFAPIVALFSFVFDLTVLEREWEQLGEVARIVADSIGAGIGLVAAATADRFVPLQPMETGDVRVTSDQLGFVNLIANSSNLRLWRHIVLLLACLVIPLLARGYEVPQVLPLAGIGTIIFLLIVFSGSRLRCPACRIRVMRAHPAAVIGLARLASCPACGYQPTLRRRDVVLLPPVARACVAALYVAALAYGFGWIGGAHG